MRSIGTRTRSRNGTAQSGPFVSAPPSRLFRPTWAEVDLHALHRNLRRFKGLMPSGTKLMFVVKGDAYGHGAVPVARWVQERRGADWLGVSSVEEGVALREAGVRLPILVLGSLYPFETFLAGVQYQLTPTVASQSGVQGLAEVARRVGARVKCHLKLDTGMGRIGMGWPSGLEVARAINPANGLELEGLYTHLSCAESDPAFTRLQLKRFMAALGDLSREGIRVRYRHAANSAAALKVPASRLDLVRPGIAIYGLARGFEPVMTLRTRLVYLKTVKPGTPIGYGRTFRTKKAARIATIPIGYADGVPRRLSNRGHVLIRGRKCPIAGVVSMDMTTIDVTAVPQAHAGDEVVLIGASGRERVGFDDWAKWSDTISYEVVTRLGHRVPRVYR
ncbi:MAG: alanine racemase [Elusimicrobia bacterium]|nr:alanine racemase [Elusimicrobiota bacterium]